MKLPAIFRQIGYLGDTIRSTYGTGYGAWGRYFYYALFRKNRFRILTASLEGDLPNVPEPPGISLTALTPAELDPLRSGSSLPREFYCDRFHRVSHCCLGTSGEEPAYIHWIYRTGDYSRFLKIGEDAAEINYMVTLPRFRGNGIAAAAIRHSMDSLRRQGVKNLFAVIHEENIASLKSFARVGFIDAGSTCSFGQFNRRVSV